MINRTQHFIVAITAVCLLTVSCSKSNKLAADAKSQGTSNSSEPAVELKVKWTPGKKTVQRMAVNSTTKNSQVTDMSWDYSLNTLKRRDDGGHEVELEFIATKFETKMGDRVYFAFDSKHDTNKQTQDPITPALRKMVGGKLRYVLGPDNKLEKVDGYEEFMVRIARGSKNPDMLKAMFNEGMLKNLCRWADALPDHPVRPGDSWKYTTEMDLYGDAKMLIDGTFTFKEWEDHGGHKCVKLDFDGKITGKNTGKAPFAIEKGRTHGSSWFDPEQGMLIGSDSDQTMTIKIEQGGNNGSQQITQNVTVSLVE